MSEGTGHAILAAAMPNMTQHVSTLPDLIADIDDLSYRIAARDLRQVD